MPGVLIHRPALPRVVLRGLLHEPSRSGLVAGCIALGVAAAVLTQALRSGARAELEARRAELDVVTVTAGRVRVPPSRGGGWASTRRLSRADVDALTANVRGIRRAAAVVEGPRPIELAGAATVASLRGVEPAYLALRGFELRRGRPFDALDRQARSRVAIVGSAVARALRAGDGLVGRTIDVGGVPFVVIGELEAKGLGPDSANEDREVLIPLETAARRVFNTDSLAAIYIEVRDRERMPRVRSASRLLLRERHALVANAPDDFEILLPTRAIRASRDRSSLLEGIGRIFSTAALAIGALGVLVVSYMNVLDRTWEVGLRRAVGARRRDIAALFLMEASALGGGGGVLGVVTAGAGGLLADGLTGWPVRLDPGTAVLAVLGSAALGIVFGAVPAILASRLSPTSALARA